MKRSNVGIIILFVLLLMTSCITAKEKSSIDTSNTEFVEKVDHILLVPDDARQLYDLFVDTFKMPIAWEYEEYNGFTSGGIHVGNVNLEMLYFSGVDETGIYGFAFEPTMKTREVKKGLEARGVMCGKPQKYSTYWTTLDILDILPDRAVFFCEYHFTDDTVYDLSRNPLQIESVTEITISTSDFENTVGKWRTLFAPVKESAPGHWDIGDGPSIVLNEGDADEIVSIQIMVKSLSNAKTFLMENNLLGTSAENILTTDPEKTNHVTLEFVER